MRAQASIAGRALHSIAMISSTAKRAAAANEWGSSASTTSAERCERGTKPRSSRHPIAIAGRPAARAVSAGVVPRPRWPPGESAAGPAADPAAGPVAGPAADACALAARALSRRS